VLSELQQRLANDIPYQLQMQGHTAAIWAGLRILSHDEAEAIVASIRAFYANISPEQLKAINWQRRVDACRQPPSQKPKKGIVYLLKSGETFKIGITTHAIGKRAAEIRRDAGLLQTPDVMHTIEAEDVIQVECFLHALFRDRHLHGEWFALTDEDVEYIQSLGGGEA